VYVVGSSELIPTLLDLVSSYICDVSDFSHVQDVAKRIREEVGGAYRLTICSDMLLISYCHVQVGSPTILVNNAGVVAGKTILDLQERDIQRCDILLPRSIYNPS
jgi:NAD(P)-dependent dehydrogenase (short-subunit alcohol dehydrogenase family)